MSKPIVAEYSGKLSSSAPVRIEPYIKNHNYAQRITYVKIRTEKLTANVLREFLEITGTQHINVTEMFGFLVYAYSGQKSIMIKLSDGLIYAENDDYYHRREAIIMLQKLSKFGLVEGYKRKQWKYSYLQNINGWRE